MTQALLESRWGETREALLEGLQGSRRTSMSVVLENTRKHLMETATAGATAVGNVATLNRVILPVIRRVMPTVIANEIVGVQPMTGPIAQIHTLRVRYAETMSDGSALATSTTAGDEALSPFKIAVAYSGDTTAGLAASTSTLEGQAGNRINVQILKQVVEAKTRKLSARWTFEAAQDAQSMHGLDVEAEIMAALAQEITVEIDQEILNSLRSLASVEETYDQALVSGTATFVGDEHAAQAIPRDRAHVRARRHGRSGDGPDAAECRRRDHRDPDEHVREVGPEQRRCDRGSQDQQAAHRGRAGLGPVRLGSFLPDHLADLEVTQLADHPRSEHEADDERRQARSRGAERDVTRHVEHRELGVKWIQQVIQHPYTTPDPLRRWVSA